MKTEIIVILDRSGSMANVLTEAIGGFNAFLKKQREEPGEARITLAQFDHEYILVHEGKDVPLVDDLTKDTYAPRGATALNDAIGRTLQAQGERIKKDGWADKVIVCVITDGMENSSKEWTAQAVKDLVKEKEAAGWSFVFLFAGLTEAQAMSTTQGYGVDTRSLNNVVRSFASGPKGQSVGESYEAMASTVTNVRGGKTAKGD
jgi:Mg-chelatase subunit ChlD